ncbi:unnamed protein product [Paramecium pentaurelia]|uniref:Transmembrane protein n=1 Tax=Paramecium pentaurelia TaxID=43138 RepID=A0A8S1XAK7_9CILI|nr:unnamed protein product [Paramecium pentaurelia]
MKPYVISLDIQCTVVAVTNNINKFIILCIIWPYLWLLYPLLNDSIGPTGWKLYNSTEIFYLFCGFEEDEIIFLIFWSIPLWLIFLSVLILRQKISSRIKTLIFEEQISSIELDIIKKVADFSIIYVIFWLTNQFVKYVQLLYDGYTQHIILYTLFVLIHNCNPILQKLQVIMQNIKYIVKLLTLNQFGHQKNRRIQKQRMMSNQFDFYVVNNLMFQYNIHDYSAYMISHDQISLTYRGEITKDIYQFKFLEFDNLEEILFLKQEETAVSLPWARTIIVNFWNVPTENYTLFNLYEGMKILFDMDIIKDLQEVQFKFFSNEQIQALIKLKWLQSENTNYFYFEIQEENQYELTLQWRDSLQIVESIKKELEKQFQRKNLIKILNKIGDYSNIYDLQELFNLILDNHYDTLFVYFPSIIKLKIYTKIFEESEEQIRSVELFIHNQWFKERQDNLIAQFEILHTQIQRSMKDSNEEIILDYALIYDEDQINCSELMSKINSLIIKILLTNNKKIQSILLSLMPLEIHFELDIKKLELNLDINLHHEDPQDIYQEGLIILLQTITTCQLFQSLKVNIQQEDDSNNIKFLLFSFIMMIHEFQQTLKNKGTFTYNNYQLIPRYHSVCSKGVMNYLISEKNQINL